MTLSTFNSVGAQRWLGRHWLLAFIIGWAAFVTLPWLAPALMRLGWDDAARVLYALYSFVCHQLPERSYFLFGEKAMYSLAEVQLVWKATANPIILRQFVGNEAMGWKVAWSDRMVSMYTSVLAAGLVFGALRRRLAPLPLWAFALLIVPMAIDGGTHFLSDLHGLADGFRYTNDWLATLTANAFPTAFYAGDAIGSFNWWARLITGGLFGLAVVWLSFPYVDEAMGTGQ